VESLVNGLCKDMAIISAGELVVGFENGEVFRVYEAEDSSWMGELLYSEEGLRGYHIIRSPGGSPSPGSGINVFIGAIDGSVTFLHRSSGQSYSLRWRACQEKVVDIVVLERSQGQFDVFVATLGVLDHEANCFWYLVSNGEGDMTSVLVANVFTVIARESADTVRSKYVMSVDLARDDGLLAIGTREGDLLLYHMDPDWIKSAHSQPAEFQCCDMHPSFVAEAAHNKEAVTCVAFKKIQKSLHLYTTGRDGHYASFQVITEPTPLSVAPVALVSIYRKKLTKGWLERLIFDGDDSSDQLLLMGFYQKRMFVYDESKKSNLCLVSCGGANRAWSLAIDRAISDASNTPSLTISFGFVRDRQLSLYKRLCGTNALDHGFTKLFLQGGNDDNGCTYHGKETRVVTFLKHKMLGSQTVVATAGEDCLLKLLAIDDAKRSEFDELTLKAVREIATLRKHISVITSVAPSQGMNRDELLLFSAGGREEIRCWKLQMGSGASRPLLSAIAGYCEMSTCPLVSTIPETRVMDMAALNASSVVAFKNGCSPAFHLLAIAYSDSTLRLWIYDEVSKKFIILGQSTWHRRCLLQAKFIVIDQNAAVLSARNEHFSVHKDVLVCTAATDGHIAVWDVTSTVVSFLETYCKFTPSATVLTMPILTVTDKTSGKRIKQQELIHALLPDPVTSAVIHQSGIEAMDILKLERDKVTYLLATGGDDNSLGLVLFYPASPAMKLEAKASMKSAHGSLIQGMSSNGTRVAMIY
jgi:WD40 repeat protein